MKESENIGLRMISVASYSLLFHTTSFSFPSFGDVISVYQHVHSHEAMLTAQPQITTAVNSKTQI